MFAHPLQVLPQNSLRLGEVKQRLHSLSVEVWFKSSLDWLQGTSPPNAQVNQIEVPDADRSLFCHHFSGNSTTDSTRLVRDIAKHLDSILQWTQHLLDVTLIRGDIGVDITQWVRISSSSWPNISEILEVRESIGLGGVFKGVDIPDVQRLTNLRIRACLKIGSSHVVQ